MPWRPVVPITQVRTESRLLEPRRRSAVAVAAHVEVRTADAGITDTYLGAVPTELVLLVGILGNISDTDLGRTIATAPALWRPAATLLWSRARADGPQRLSPGSFCGCWLHRARLCHVGSGQLAGRRRGAI
jgi:hypothetical protein